MTTLREQLRPEALDSLGAAVAGHFTGSQITQLFRHSGYPEIVHDGSTKARFVAHALAQLQDKGRGSPSHVLKVVETACSPQRWFSRSEEFSIFLAEVNAVLGFYALHARDDGCLVRTSGRMTTLPAKPEEQKAFDARRFHGEVRKHGRELFSRGDAFHAVFECCKAFDVCVRENSQIADSGRKLMAAAFSLGGPIKLNAQRTQSENDEQEGVKFLAMGLMDAVRNPEAHEPVLDWPMSSEDALDVLALVSFLFRKLEGAMIVLPDGSPPQRAEL